MSKNPDTAMILVMGATGTGKTEFIKLLTQDEGIEVGYGLDPGAGELELSKFFLKERAVEFVDCPGFDDSRKDWTDADIFKTIAAFLDSAPKPGVNLHGVLFMHRISSKVDNLTKHNLKMLQKICGSDALKNVIVVTTMWDSVSDDIATAGEKALTLDPNFKPLLSAGAKLLRHDDDFTSAYTITKTLLGMPPVRLLVQTELETGKGIPATSAGSELSAVIQALIASHQKEIRKVRDELTEAIDVNNQAAKRELELERKTLAKYLKDFETDRRKLDESMESVRAKAEAKRKAAEMEAERQRSAFLEKLLLDAMGNKGLDVTVESWRKDREKAKSLLREEKVLRELFLASGEQWSVVNVADGVYKVVGTDDVRSGSSPLFWLIDTRNDDFELKSKGTGDVFRLQGNKDTKTATPGHFTPFKQFANRPLSSGDGGYGQSQQFNQFNRFGSGGPTQTSSTFSGNERNGQVKPGKYNIRNRETLNLLCVYETYCTLPEAKLQILGKGMYSYVAGYEFTVSEEKNGLVAITSTFYRQATPRYMVDKGGAMMNITKAGRVRLIHAGMEFYYIVLDLEKNMVLTDPNAQNISNGYSVVDELDEGNRRQLWEFVAVAE